MAERRPIDQKTPVSAAWHICDFSASLWKKRTIHSEASHAVVYVLHNAERFSAPETGKSRRNSDRRHRSVSCHWRFQKQKSAAGRKYHYWCSKPLFSSAYSYALRSRLIHVRASPMEIVLLANAVEGVVVIAEHNQFTHQSAHGNVTNVRNQKIGWKSSLGSVSLRKLDSWSLMRLKSRSRMVQKPSWVAEWSVKAHSINSLISGIIKD